MGYLLAASLTMPQNTIDCCEINLSVTYKLWAPGHGKKRQPVGTVIELSPESAVLLWHKPHLYWVRHMVLCNNFNAWSKPYQLQGPYRLESAVLLRHEPHFYWAKHKVLCNNFNVWSKHYQLQVTYRRESARCHRLSLWLAQRRVSNARTRIIATINQGRSMWPICVFIPFTCK